MRFSDYVAFLALLGGTTVSAFGRHAAHQGLLQMSPSFAKEGINLYPALHPEHNATDLNHLVPEISKHLHFSQEGHRRECLDEDLIWRSANQFSAALHGAKHAHLEGTFSHPTVVLEHSSHIQDVVCTERQIQVFFKTHEALATVEKHWQEETTAQGFNLITYHIDCGHLTGEQRSIFRASQPRVDGNSITVTAHLVDESEAIHGGNLEWGTYQKPGLAKRQPVKGHVRASRPQEVIVDGEGGNATMDITKDADAFHAFFPNVNINTDIPDRGTEGGGFLNYDGFEDDDLARRGLFSWIINAFKALIDLVAQQIERQIQLIIAIANVMVAIAATVVNLLLVPFGFPFNQEYHADISFNHYVPRWIGIGSDPATTIAGAVANSNIPGTVDGVEEAIKKGLITEDQAIASGLKGKDLRDALELVYSKAGASLYLNCDSCGTKGNFTFDGKLAFSIAEGLTKAQVSLINNEEFVLEAIVGLKLQGRAIAEGQEGPDGKKKGLRSTVSKEIATIPLSPFHIPALLTIGPQIKVEPAASLYADGAINIRTGPRFTVSPGNVTLDAKNPSQNVAQGWEPNFEFVFEQDASVVVTADVALEVGIEVALDVLTGTYKTAAGIYTAPSVYLTAEYSKNIESGDTEELKACDGGLELRVGAKNRVYSSVFGLREWEFKELGTTFADHGLGCVLGEARFDSKAVEKTKVLEGYGFETGVGKEVSKQLNDLIQASQKPKNVTSPDKIELGEQHAAALKHKNKQGTVEKMPHTHGFRVVQDAGMTSTLVSGTDGRVYMTDNSADHDLSAPWGALDVKKEQFNYDVFGRLMWFNASRIKDWNSRMVEIGVAPAERMPKGVNSASFKVIKDNHGNESFAMALNATGSNGGGETPEWVWYPTVCQIPGRGLQLFASNYIVTERGLAAFNSTEADLLTTYKYWEDFYNLGLFELTQGSTKKKQRKGVPIANPDRFKEEKGIPIADFERWFPQAFKTELASKPCRTVRLISGLKKKGSDGLVPDVVKGVAAAGEEAVGAVDKAVEAV